MTAYEMRISDWSSDVCSSDLSELLQKKLDRWIFGPFLKALARRKKVIWLGNMLQKTSLLARLSQRPNWNPVVYGCLVETESGDIVPLWPERWPLQELIEDYQEYFEMGLTEAWLCEMMRSEEHTSELQSLMRISYYV